MRELRNIRTPLAMAITVASATMMLGTSGAQAQAKAAVLEEVVVTARKREESLQDLGQSVSAFSAAEIENRFAGNIDNLTDISPNLVIDDTAQGPGGVAAIYIRGIGVAEVESSFDPAVGVVVDGMFLGKASGSLTQLIDVERIEVLRGPQGTLFGRNSIGGVINIARKQPTQELSGKVRASYGNYDTTKFDGYTSFGLTDNLALKLNYSNHDQGEGYFDNLTTGTEDGEVEYEMYGAHLLWTPTTDLELEYSYTEEKYDQDAPPLQNVSLPGQLTCDVYNFCSPDSDTPISGDRYDVVADGRNQASFDAQTHIAKANWIINNQYSLDYIFGYRETEEEVLQDWDATPLPLYHTSRPEDYEQTSNELRLNFSGDRLNYVVGLYQFNMEYTIDLLSFIGFADPTAPVTVPQTVNQETDTYAAFFEADYNLTDKWVLTVGGRYGTDEKSTHVTNDLVIDMPSEVDEDWSEFTPKVGLKYFASPELMVYGLYSSGYRAGGFSGRPTTQEAAEIPYDPETVDNLEAGFKSEWLNQRLRINGAIFYMEYDDKQEEQRHRRGHGAADDCRQRRLRQDLRYRDGFCLSASRGRTAVYRQLRLSGRRVRGFRCQHRPGWCHKQRRPGTAPGAGVHGQPQRQVRMGNGPRYGVLAHRLALHR